MCSCAARPVLGRMLVESGNDRPSGVETRLRQAIPPFLSSCLLLLTLLPAEATQRKLDKVSPRCWAVSEGPMFGGVVGKTVA